MAYYVPSTKKYLEETTEPIRHLHMYELWGRGDL